MLYLLEFRLPTDEEEEYFFNPNNPAFKKKNFRTIYATRYPFFLFEHRGLPMLEMEDITIFCGGNGCGKSTLLNLIAEKLGLPRDTPYNRSDFFDDYAELCDYVLDRSVSPESCIVTSDDVFERVLDIRRLNDGIDAQRESLIKEYIEEKGKQTPNLLTSLEDYDDWKRKSDIRKRSTTQSKFIRQNLIRNLEARSNGESALSFFVDKIVPGGLYLLDEPENSLSPANQLRLKAFLEDCAEHDDCQFIISTHSPFLLSLRGAKIYDLDSVPIAPVENWTELETVRVYHDFFQEREGEF